ncbi:DUF5005 domain-containing protein [Streptomyces sp. B6B3]|uniref:DUF5005 domain-containing protein n=1 Tax=Streptomyces sp. B6B3 TaxID=3153570 RepID=UPI00325F7B8A
MLRRIALPATAALVAAAAAVPGSAATPAPPRAAEVCAGVPAPSVESAAPDTALTEDFARYATEPTTGAGHWTGADSTYSAELPGGDRLWIFSDTFLGQVNPDGSRSPTVGDGGTTPFLNNTFVRTRPDGDLSTITGGTEQDPESLLPPPAADHWYWARDGMVLDGELNVIYSEFRRTGSGSLDFAWDRNVLARFPLDGLGEPTSVTEIPSATGISWGAWLLRDGGHTYVYGSEDLGAEKFMHVARVAGADLQQPWEYRTADGGWSTRESDSARIDADAGSSVLVSNEFSVARHGDVYVLVTQELDEPFSAEIDLMFSCSPTGPFVHETTAYRTPETGATGSYGNPNVFTYNPHEHRGLGDDDELLVSYNVNSLVGSDLYADASIYRPRFVEITLG